MGERKAPSVDGYATGIPVPKLALEAMPLTKPGVSAPSMTSLPEAFTNTSPAAPPPHVEVEITPLFRIDTLSEVTIIRPALPPLGSNVRAMIPAGTNELGLATPSITRSPVRFTVMSPPAPVPVVEAEISPALVIASEPALTVTSPPAPEPDVEAETAPPLLSDSEPALTVTSLAFPPPVPDSEVIPVVSVCEVPSIDTGPGTLTVTLPPAPPPNVEAETRPSFTIESALALTITTPPAPEPKVEAEISPPLLIASDPVLT